MVERTVHHAARLAEKARKSGDDDYWGGVALDLHGFYSGAEQIFEDIARTIDGDIPSAEEWHTKLLRQMAVEMGRLRPAVISAKTRQCLDEYRGFRHVVRNVYAFNLRPARLAELVNDAPGCLARLKSELLAFANFLEKTA